MQSTSEAKQDEVLCQPAFEANQAKPNKNQRKEKKKIKKRKNNKKKIKRKRKKIEKKEKIKKGSKKKKSLFFCSPGQSVHLLSLPHS